MDKKDVAKFLKKISDTVKEYNIRIILVKSPHKTEIL